jgi:coatomer subunit beta'
LLLYSSTGHAEGIEKLAELSKLKGKLNIAFIASFLRGRTADCLEMLLAAGRAPEAAFMARTYMPSEVSRMVLLWREQLRAVNPKAADSIADPADYANLFEGLEHALEAEAWLAQHQLQEAAASVYPEHANDTESDLIEHMKLLALQPAAEPPEEIEPPETAAPAVETLPEQADAELEIESPVADAEAALAAELDMEQDASLEAEVQPVLPAEAEVQPVLPAEVESAADQPGGPTEADGVGDAEADLAAELDAELEAELNM